MSDAYYSVTPFVGVWIETVNDYISCYLGTCHTLRGCVDWNLLILVLSQRLILSHPSWVCGLKLGICNSLEEVVTSHPSWVCGLKLGLLVMTLISWMSHPSWVCGLKQGAYVSTPEAHAVTPFVGVWIETKTGGRVTEKVICHTLRGCVDWNLIFLQSSSRTKRSHPSWVCGLKHVTSRL